MRGERPWSPDGLDSLRQMLGAGWTLAEAAEVMDRSPAGCDRAANSLLGRTPAQALPFVNAILREGDAEEDDAAALAYGGSGW